jgi:hypothetical protein
VIPAPWSVVPVRLSDVPGPWAFLGPVLGFLSDVIALRCHRCMVLGPWSLRLRSLSSVRWRSWRRVVRLLSVTGPLPGFACQIRAVRGPWSPLRGPPLARPRVYHYFCRYFFSREKFTAELNFLRLFRIRNDPARWTSTPFFDKTPQGSRTPVIGKMFHVKHPSSSKYDYPTPAAGPGLLRRLLEWLRSRRPWAKL